MPPFTHPAVRFLLLAALTLGLAASASAQDAPSDEAGRSRITVTGEGTARIAPDLAVTSLTVLRTGETAAAALAAANAAAADVTAALREFGIQSRDLQTEGFSINPQYRYDNREDGTQGPPTIVGYEVRNTLSVRVRDLSRLGEILDRSVTLGVNEGGSISFQTEDPTAIRNESRRDAVADARASAETLADAAGVLLGRVVQIADEAGPSDPIPMASELRMMAPAPASSQVPIETGESVVRTRVTVVFELLPADGG